MIVDTHVHVVAQDLEAYPRTLEADLARVHAELCRG